MSNTLEKSTKTWPLVAIAVAMCAVHATLFYLRWYHNMGASASVLTVTFWVAISSLVSCLILIKGSKKSVKLSLLLGVVILLPGAMTCINWTIWSVLGFFA
jgi:hypothetical protein